MAHLKAQEFGKGKEDERKKWKFYLIRMLYKRGYTRKDILELCRFVDWLMVLPESLERQLSEELAKTEEEKNMPYITSWERIGKKEGKKEGMLEERKRIIIEMVRERFGKTPRDISNTIRQINDTDLLKSLLMQSVRCPDLNSFRENLKQKNFHTVQTQ
ncbi:MAG: hypothetical protein V2I97_20545 [Desulfococcaceae bacterium]|nr:hypothetical protein [Desulfococcaceae bacterium]